MVNFELSNSDERLVERIRQRDVNAFSALYDRYAQAVYGLAVRMIGGTDAEEIVQDVFLQLWHKADQYDPARGSFAAWFMTIARRKMLDRLRTLNRQDRAILADDIGEQLLSRADDALSVEEQAWLRDCGEAAREALNELPEEQRRVLLLAYFGGLSHSMIAEHLGLPLGTVKKRIQLGLHKLRVALVRCQDAESSAANVDPTATSTSNNGTLVEPTIPVELE
jgi:RNA polymerase sigma-70 factor (ECF subfamily)